MPADLNRDGQPIVRAFSFKRVETRTIDELIGLCKGVLADGVVVDEEARFIYHWLEANREYANEWPANVLYLRIREMLIDGVLDETEEQELVGLLADLTGGSLIHQSVANMSTSLPLDNPLPSIEFAQKSFCLTGKFAFGSRKRCEMAITERGGTIHGALTQATSYLVIGIIGSRDWIHSTHGRKIEKAISIRDKGLGIRIVSEEHWAKHL